MFDWLKNGKNHSKLGLMILGAAVGILLLVIGGTNKSETETAVPQIYDPKNDETVIYQKYLEQEIQKLCQSVSGVGDVTVAVTLSTGFESIYATEWKDGEESYVIVGSGSSASALYLSRAVPAIAGIGIVCSGGGSERVRNELIPLISATFSVGSNRIYVTEART